MLAVCDVFDALISKRVYREAWTRDDALALLRREAGTEFDPRCVEALERVLAREAGATESQLEDAGATRPSGTPRAPVLVASRALDSRPPGA